MERQGLVEAPVGQHHALIGIVEDEAVGEIVDRLAQHQFGTAHPHLLGDVDERYQHRRLALPERSEEHTSELQSLMRISYAVFCLKKKIKITTQHKNTTNN